MVVTSRCPACRTHRLGVTGRKFSECRQRFGWFGRHRRLTFMMLDADVVAVSPATVGRALKQAGRLTR
jgi:hypothetical protein